MTSGFPMEMHALFVAWFLWGFWANVAILALNVLLMPLGFMKKERTGMILGSVFCGFYCINTFVWLAFGGIWRFSKAGVVASGDKLERLYGTTDAQWAQSLEAA